MTHLDLLRQSKTSKATAFFLFLTAYLKTENHIHVFFEGNDDASFYLNFIQRFIKESDGLEVYKCGTKKAVYDTYDLVMQRAKSDAKVLFFVDKDFSDILNEQWLEASNIFVTEHYSIENYLVDEQVLVRVWHDLLHSPFDREELGTIIQLFNDKLAEFHIFMLPITAFILASKQSGNRPNLGNIKVSQLCTIDDDYRLSCKSLGDSFSMLTVRCGVVTQNEFQADGHPIVTALNAIEPKKYIRGKFELEFFVAFVNRLILNLKGTQDQRNVNIKVRVNVSAENAVEVLGPRVNIPISLQTFLQRNLNM